MTCRQCLPFSLVKLKGKYCQKNHCCNGFVYKFGLSVNQQIKPHLTRWHYPLITYLTLLIEEKSRVWQRQNPVELLVKTRLCFSWQISISVLRSVGAITKSDSAYLKRKFQHTGRSRQYRNNLILQFQSESLDLHYSNLCKNVKIIRRKDNLELGWEAEIKLLQPKPVKSDFFFPDQSKGTYLSW